MNKPCLRRINAALDSLPSTVTSSLGEPETNAMYVLSELLNNPDNTQVQAAFRQKDLERYAVLPGKIFATDFKAKDKYKILRLVANDVIYKNLSTGDVKTEEINSLLSRWNKQQIKEISLVTEVLKLIKTHLGPLLGVFLTSVLVGWLVKKL